MEHLIELLHTTKLLGDISPETIRRCIVPSGSIQRYPKDGYLIMAYQQVDTVKILLEGKVNLIYYYADGSYSLAGTELPLRVLNLDLIATKSRVSPYYAVAAEACTVFSFPANVIFRQGSLPEEERQNIINQILVMLSHLQMQKEKRLMILSRNGLRDRIMTYLSLQAQRKKSPTFTTHFSREEMAAYLCVNRSALSHELSLMRQEGLIDFSKHSFTLLKYDPKWIP